MLCVAERPACLSTRAKGQQPKGIQISEICQKFRCTSRIVSDIIFPRKLPFTYYKKLRPRRPNEKKYSYSNRTKPIFTLVGCTFVSLLSYYLHTNTHAHTHIHTHTHTHTHAPTPMHVQGPMCTCACTHARTHASTHTHTHTCAASGTPFHSVQPRFTKPVSRGSINSLFVVLFLALLSGLKKIRVFRVLLLKSVVLDWFMVSSYPFSVVVHLPNLAVNAKNRAKTTILKVMF